MRNLLERIDEIERRVHILEQGGGTGISGTDQTIRDSHDRLDSLLGAGGTLTGAMLATFHKYQIADNTPTAVFTITTTNETGSMDGGGWAAHLFILAGVDVGAQSTMPIAKAQQAMIAHVNVDAGTAATATDTLHTGSAADGSGALTTIDSVTVTTTATSNYVTTVNITIDAGGALFTDGQATIVVLLEWNGYATAPVMAAA